MKTFEPTKKPVYHHLSKDNRLVQSTLFAKSMERLARFYAEYNYEHDRVQSLIDCMGYNYVYDTGLFAKVDKAIDKLADCYNYIHGTDYTGHTLSYKGDGLRDCYFTAQAHGLV